MDIRYSASPNDVKRYTTEELRKEFLITDLYEPDTVKATYSHVDRMVVMGIIIGVIDFGSGALVDLIVSF